MPKTETRMSPADAAEYISGFPKLSPREQGYRERTERVVVDGNIEIPVYAVSIPPNMEFAGDVDARNCRLARFNSRVDGNAFFRGSKFLTEFGSDARFGGILNASETSISEFNHEVAGAAIFEKTASLVKFGPDARFRAMLDARGTSIAEFNCQVDGRADFGNVSTLERFGPDARFGDDLIAAYTSIASFNHPVGGIGNFSGCSKLAVIGPNASFVGNVFLRKTPLSTLPAEVSLLLDRGRLSAANRLVRPGQAVVGASADAVVWVAVPPVTTVPDDVNDALRLTASLCGPLVFAGDIETIDGHPAFHACDLLFSEGKDLQGIDARERMKQACTVIPYYDAARQRLLDGEKALFPSAPAPSQAEAAARVQER